MKTIKLSLLIYTAALLLVLLPHTLYSFFKKILEQPKLNVRIELLDESHAQQKWMLEETEKGEPLYAYEVFWHFKLLITNHAKYLAHNPEICISFHVQYGSFIESLKQNTIAPSETVVTKGYYSRFERCRQGEHTDPHTLPKEFDKATLLLTYRNQHGIKFYTVFDFKEGRNTNSRNRPAEFI